MGFLSLQFRIIARDDRSRLSSDAMFQTMHNRNLLMRMGSLLRSKPDGAARIPLAAKRGESVMPRNGLAEAVEVGFARAFPAPPPGQKAPRMRSGPPGKAGRSLRRGCRGVLAPLLLLAVSKGGEPFDGPYYRERICSPYDGIEHNLRMCGGRKVKMLPLHCIL